MDSTQVCTVYEYLELWASVVEWLVLEVREAATAYR